MNTTCPHCKEELAFKVLKTKDFGEHRRGMHFSTPICGFCNQPLVVNELYPRIVKEIFEGVLVLTWIALIYSYDISSEKFGIFSTIGIIAVYLIAYILYSKMVPNFSRYSKYET